MLHYLTVFCLPPHRNKLSLHTLVLIDQHFNPRYGLGRLGAYGLDGLGT